MMAKLLQKIKNLHKKTGCKGEYCPFHRPSKHPMVKWDMVIRFDRGALVERICSHGIGHPDPDSLAYLAALSRELEREPDEGIHGCDGCCSKKKKKSAVKWKVTRKPKLRE